MTQQQLTYISHGAHISGGYLHEKLLAESLAQALNLELNELRYWKHFETIPSHFNLLFKAFSDTKGSLVISVARLSIPVLCKSLFSKNKVLLVWHYHDKEDGKGMVLKLWYQWSLNFIKLFPTNKVKLVCVAPFWSDYFSKKVGSSKVLLFPNLFDSSLYKKHIGIKKNKEIHMGQVSFKNSTDLLSISKVLTSHGYTCFYSTNQKALVHKSIDPNAEIRYFERQEDFWMAMAKSQYTLALPAINEGWNRIAHESILVGTPVIGYPKGGLTDLLTFAGMPIAKDTKELIEMVLNQTIGCEPEKLFVFESSNISQWLEPIKSWINANS